MPQVKYRHRRQQIGQLSCSVIEPDQTPKALGVFCHGFGASGDDLLGLAPDLLESRSHSEPIQLVFPSGLLSLADEGYGDGRAWWRLSIQRLINALEQGQYELVKDESPPGIEDARQALVDLVESFLQATNLDYTRLLLGGFSQGAMLSMEVACCGLPQPPAAMALYSGCLIRERQWKSTVARLSGTKIVQSHGALDPILPLKTGQWLRDLLQAAGCTVQFQQFHGPHTIPGEAIEATANLLDELTG